MGDLIGDGLRSNLVYSPVSSLRSAAVAEANPYERTLLFADLCRLNALYMIARAGSGHIGSSFSSLDVVSWLLLQELRADDVYFSSKGHDAPGLYAALIGLGKLPEASLHQLRRLGGLPGHPDVATPGIAANSGSLGMGISKAKGMVLAHRLRGEQRRVFVLTGDGELQEGQIWESLAGAVRHEMTELTVVVDHNKYQSDRALRVTSDLGDLAAKLHSFGWHVERVDGHDPCALAEVCERTRSIALPKCVIADTIKGRGVSFIEHTALPDEQALYRFHSGALDAESYQAAVRELSERIMARAERCNVRHMISFSNADIEPSAAAPETSRKPERLIPAYGRALLAHAKRDPRVVVLDADLMVDMGLLPLQHELPERFVECGIAEMDMVSQAGGLALRGLIPVCHSFACFMTTRANEQIYTNATERTKIIYTAGLAGLLPAAPGHSHQSVRDISILAAIPGMTLLQPSCERELEAALAYCIERAAGSCYLRLCSVPWTLPFDPPSSATLSPGCGSVIRSGADAALIAYGPVMLTQAYLAAERLARSHGIHVHVLALPWLNCVDDEWLREAIGSRRWLFTLDDHYVRGGQGDMIWSRLAQLRCGVRGKRFGVSTIPACGAADEVLRHHGLDAASLCSEIAATLRAH